MRNRLHQLIIPFFADEQKQNQAIILLIMTIGLFIRLYRLSSIPPGISGDELFNAIDAWRIGKEHWPIYFEGNNGREAFFLYLMALSLRWLGQTIFAIRLPAALLGTGCVALGYLIGRNAYNRRVGLWAAALTAVSLWPLMESRWGLRAISLAFATALAVYFLDKGWRDNRRRDWVLGGAALGLTLYTYIPSRLFPAVILVWFGWLFGCGRERIRRAWRHMALSWLVALIIFAPFGWYILQNRDKVNQRIGTLTIALDDALAGNPAALVEPVTGVLQMFTIQGDIEWRYHLSGRPIFDPVTGMFFYAGVAVCLWRAFSRRDGGGNRPAYAMLLLWAGAMLAPNAILEANSSFLRAAGAIVPIYLITAVGLDAVYIFIQERWPQWAKRPWLPALVTMGLILTLLDSWHSYFAVWNNNSEVRQIYQADLALIGRYLDEHPPPPAARIFIAHSYAIDLAPKTFAYYSRYPVSWFRPENSFVWPETAAIEAVWYFTPTTEPLPDEVVQQLSLETVASEEHYAGGEVAFTLYRSTPEQLAWAPQYETALEFVDGPRLIGYDLPGTIYRGDALPLVLHWRAPAGQPRLPNRITFVQARLEDAQGNLWAKSSNLLGYPQAHWSENDRFVQLLTLEVPGGMLPGPAYLRFDLFGSDGALYPITGTASNRAGPFVVSSRPVADFTPAPDMLVLDGTLALQNAAFSSLLAPGLPANIALDWVALETPAVDYRIQLQLVQPGATEPFLAQTFAIWPEAYPPSRWQAGEQVSSFHRLDVPLDIPTDTNPELRLQLLLPDEDEPLPVTQGDNKLADMTFSLRDHLFELPPISHPAAAQFGDSIQLLGYDIDTGNGRPGGEVLLTLYWQALATPPANYTVFNHLVAPDGQMQGQFDSPPVGDAWLTGTWLPGEIVIDRRTIPIRPGAGDGRYALIVGLYTPGSGQRLPITVAGQPQANDQLFLTNVIIGP